MVYGTASDCRLYENSRNRGMAVSSGICVVLATGSKSIELSRIRLPHCTTICDDIQRALFNHCPERGVERERAGGEEKLRAVRTARVQTHDASGEYQAGGVDGPCPLSKLEVCRDSRAVPRLPHPTEFCAGGGGVGGGCLYQGASSQGATVGRTSIDRMSVWPIFCCHRFTKASHRFESRPTVRHFLSYYQ